MNLLRMALLTTDPSYEARADRVLGAFAPSSSAPLLAAALSWRHGRPLELLVISPRGASPPEALLDAIRRRFIPYRALFIVDEQEAAALTEQVPWLASKVAIGGRATAYVCEEGVCELPTSDPELLGQQLDARLGATGATSSTPPPR